MSKKRKVETTTIMPSEEYVQTVLGRVSPSEIGPTMCHEHVLIDSSALAREPLHHAQKFKDMNLTIENLWLIRQFPYALPKNLVVDEVDVSTEEMNFYKQSGGSSIVECSVTGLSRNLEHIKQISLDSGVHISAGTGYYVDPSLTNSQKALSAETIHDEILGELTEGKNGIICGHIGEVGISYPMTEFERKSTIASALAHAQTGAPLIFHPGRHPDSPNDILRIVTETIGGNGSKIIMSHLDRTFKLDGAIDFAENYKSILQYDLFGIEVSFYQVMPELDMISDAQRLQLIEALVKEGYGERLTMAQDIHTKHRFMKYGGHGYSHVLLNIVPWMKLRGFEQKTIDDILVNTPRRWLTRNA